MGLSSASEAHPRQLESRLMNFFSLSLIFFISMYANRINLIFKIDSSIKLKKTSSGNLSSYESLRKLSAQVRKVNG